MKIDLRKSLLILPNLLTCAGIYCGYQAILLSTSQASAESYYRAALFIVYAMFFDTIDGRVARLTRTQSAFGVQIDSLADLLSFGVAPAVLMGAWSLHELGFVGGTLGFVFVVCGAIRLARFNVMAAAASGAPKAPSKYNLGLPIPGAAGILVALVVADHAAPDEVFDLFLGKPPRVGPWVIAGVVFSLSVLMVSTVRFRSFKNLKFSWQTILLVSAAIGSSLWIAIRYHASLALLWILSAYVLLAVTESLFRLPLRWLGLLPDGLPDSSSANAAQNHELSHEKSQT